jgi:hypothetical protein
MAVLGLTIDAEAASHGMQPLKIQPAVRPSGFGVEPTVEWALGGFG